MAQELYGVFFLSTNHFNSFVALQKICIQTLSNDDKNCGKGSINISIIL